MLIVYGEYYSEIMKIGLETQNGKHTLCRARHCKDLCSFANCRRVFVALKYNIINTTEPFSYCANIHCITELNVWFFASCLLFHQQKYEAVLGCKRPAFIKFITDSVSSTV